MLHADSVITAYNDMQIGYLFEMAMGRPDNISMLNDERMQKQFYSSTVPKMKNSVDLNGVTVHFHKTAGTTRYMSSIGDRVVHMASFAVSSGRGLPFEHQHQDLVDQSKDAPIGFARSVVLHHLNSTNLPITTSDDQTSHGQKLWRKLVPQAISLGLHVYHWDGSALHKTTQENMDAHLKNSVSDYDASAATRHMIISKVPLNV